MDIFFYKPTNKQSSKYKEWQFAKAIISLRDIPV